MLLDNAQCNRSLSHPAWAENADARCFLLDKQLGDLFNNEISTMEDCWFQRHLLNDGVRPLGIRQNLLHILHVFTHVIYFIGYMLNVFAYTINFIGY